MRWIVGGFVLELGEEAESQESFRSLELPLPTFRRPRWRNDVLENSYKVIEVDLIGGRKKGV